MHLNVFLKKFTLQNNTIVETNLVDVCAADDGIDVVDDHHLRVNVDRRPERLPENPGEVFGRNFKSIQVRSGSFSLSRAHEKLKYKTNFCGSKLREIKIGFPFIHIRTGILCHSQFTQMILKRNELPRN